MPDWQQLVRARLGLLGLPREREEEIALELARHLEDVEDNWREQGASAENAAARAMQEVPDWAEFRREIRLAEGEENMNQRTRTVWLPGLITLTLAMGILLALNWAGLRPRIVWLDTRTPQPLVFYLPWLVILPAVGALGAYWSRRAGGRFRERLLAATFPAVALSGLFAVVFLLGAAFVDTHVPLALKAMGLVRFLIGWGLIPGAALLGGALLFLRNHPCDAVD